MRIQETSRDIFISKQFVCEVKCTENCSCILIFALASMFHYLCVCGSVIFAREVFRDLLMIH